MLHFLFSFCDTRGDATAVERKDEPLKAAFGKARELANEVDTPLRRNLNLAYVAPTSIRPCVSLYGHSVSAKDEVAMYLPLVKAFNYALDRLSSFKVPDLPEYREEGQIVFARSATKCIKPESYRQGSFKPDIILVKWGALKKGHRCRYPDVAYSQSWESDVYCESGCDEPTFNWRNLLSTLEVKHGGKAKGEGFPSKYTRDFSDLGGDLEVVAPPGSPRPAQLKMASEENPTRSCKFTTPSPLLTFSRVPVGTRSGLRNQESPSSTSDRPLILQKRRRTLHELSERFSKKSKSDSNTKPDVAGGREPETSTSRKSGAKAEGSNELEVEVPKQVPRVQSAIYASHKLSSSFDTSHTINLLLIGT